jgi:hypothetical protein
MVNPVICGRLYVRLSDYRRHGEAEDRSMRWVGDKLQRPAMLLHHGAAQAQAQTHALGLGRKKRLKTGDLNGVCA